LKNTDAPIVAEPRLFDLTAAARYLGTTVWRMRTLVWDKKLVHIRLGKKIMLDRADLDAFVEAQKRVA
jgi:excisionase family DNA binding protein